MIQGGIEGGLDAWCHFEHFRPNPLDPDFRPYDEVMQRSHERMELHLSTRLRRGRVRRNEDGVLGDREANSVVKNDDEHNNQNTSDRW